MQPIIDNIQQAVPGNSPSVVPGGPQLNGLRHGRRAAGILLPGEDADEFHALLQEIYTDHRPRTRREMRCVEAIADYEWCLERNGIMRQYYHGKLRALQTGDPAAQPHCEHDPHRWHHQAQDCTREERRLKKLRQETLEELETLKQLRRQNLLNDAMQALEGPVARPVLPKAAPATQPVVPAPPPEKPATPSPDGRKQNFPERGTWVVPPAPMAACSREGLPGAVPEFPAQAAAVWGYTGVGSM